MTDAADELFARLDAPKPPRTLMSDGKWKVPPKQRVPVLPAPEERPRNEVGPYHIHRAKGERL